MDHGVPHSKTFFAGKRGALYAIAEGYLAVKKRVGCDLSRIYRHKKDGVKTRE
jgi:hypothetical protein